MYGSPLQWPRIHEANRTQIEDPDLIFPDQVLTLP
jgi:nucleoid-associated protein YgaU